MKNIKTVKLVRLSLIAVFMSIGFTFLSCSPTDELSDDSCECGTVIGRRVEDNAIQRNWYYLKLDFACDEREDSFVYVDEGDYYNVNDGDFFCEKY